MLTLIAVIFAVTTTLLFAQRVKLKKELEDKERELNRKVYELKLAASENKKKDERIFQLRDRNQELEAMLSRPDEDVVTNSPVSAPKENK